MTHPFDRAQVGSTETLREQSRRSYESSRVLRLVTTLADARYLRSVQRTICTAEKRETGNYRLSFRALNTEFHNFPYILGADPIDGAKLHLSQEAMLPALFTKFSAAPFVPALEMFMQGVRRPHGDERAAGLVFRRKGIPQGLLILEQGASVPSHYHGVALTHTVSGIATHVVSYADFLIALRDSGISLN